MYRDGVWERVRIGRGGDVHPGLVPTDPFKELGREVGGVRQLLREADLPEIRQPVPKVRGLLVFADRKAVVNGRQRTIISSGTARWLG